MFNIGMQHIAMRLNINVFIIAMFNNLVFGTIMFVIGVLNISGPFSCRVDLGWICCLPRHICCGNVSVTVSLLSVDGHETLF